MGPLSHMYAHLLSRQPEIVPGDEPDVPMSADEWAREQAFRSQLTRGDDGGHIDLNSLPDHPGFTHGYGGMGGNQAYEAARGRDRPGIGETRAGAYPPPAPAAQQGGYTSIAQLMQLLAGVR